MCQLDALASSENGLTLRCSAKSIQALKCDVNESNTDGRSLAIVNQ